MHPLLLTSEQQELLLSPIREAMRAGGIDLAIISSNANIYYLTGGVFSGFLLIYADGRPCHYFVKRPVHFDGENISYIRKPEDMAPAISGNGTVAVEQASMSYALASRIATMTGDIVDISGILARCRSVKTPYELALLRISGAKHDTVYRRIPYLYQPGMTDLELQVEIERLSRLKGCLGQFRIAGGDMELHMGNILAGDNADAPSPYDFAMGGAGINPSLPVGANGSIICPGMAVMVDMNGNFTGYMTDMTRTFALGKLPREAVEAHQLSIEICRELQDMARPGVEAKALYEHAHKMAHDAGLADYFMGHRQHAGFVGHGIGIEVNELPVLAPRSRDIIAEGNVIAIEPKFVIPHVGAVGIENTYAVVKDGPMECLTRAPQEIIQLEK